MHKLSLIILTIVALAFTACQPNSSGTEDSTGNPLLSEFDTQFGLPPFGKIKNEHYMPAFEQAMQEHNDEIASIIANDEEPTFENTLLAMERAGSTLGKVSRVFYALSGANTNDDIKKISQDLAPLTSKHYDAIYMNKDLFARVEAVYNKRESLNLEPHNLRLLEKAYKGFVRSGAQLPEDKQQRLSEINQEISLLTVKFGQNNLAEINDWKMVVEDITDLGGLPKNVLDAAAEEAARQDLTGKWVFTLSNPSVMPFLQFAENRDLREKIWRAYSNRANNDNDNNNKENITKITNLRLEKANLLGYKTHGHFILEENMAGNAENVMNLLNQLWTPAIKVAKQEAADIQKMIDAEGGDFKLAPWDWRYYSEKVRKEKYDIDEQELKEYFSLDAVTEGVFQVCKNLFGISFTELKDAPKYHEEVSVWEVKEADGSHLGVLYMDFHPRASKRGGAWMTSFRTQGTKDGKREAPIISIVCNFSKPTGDKPALLTYDEMTTYFHEFGHALHGLFSDVEHRSQAGTSVSRDFVELPSKLMENWATEPSVIKMFAKHYQTGETIPDELIEKIKNAGTYGQGFATVEYLASSFLDMEYHDRTTALEEDPVEFENRVLKQKGLIDEIIARHRSTYFNHIFSGGYSAGYYSYIWSEVLDADAFTVFKKNGVFDQNTAASLRKHILSTGGTADPMELYKRFKGSEPSIDALLVNRGLKI
jgi:peptidyl-dipeptidase Dcp